MQFTEKYILAQKPKKIRYEIREKSGEGLAIRISTKGEKSWIFFYAFEGRKRRMTLGSYPDCSLGDARKRHRAAIKTLESGADPGLEKQKKKIDSRTSLTVNDLIEEYIEKWAKQRKRSWKEDQRILGKDIKPLWGKRKAKDITKREVILLLESIHARGAPIAANRTLACVRRMFNFAVERDVLMISPCFSVKAIAKENRCDRCLSVEEIKNFWFALNNAPMEETTKLALKLQLVTAQRKGEIASAEWSEMDLSTGWWTIPAQKAKNGQTHRIWLSSLTLELLNEIKKYSSDSRWLFPTLTTKLKTLANKLQSCIDQTNGKIVFSEWDEINLESRLWTIPITKSNDHKLHQINLSEDAIKYLYNIKKISNEKKFLFPKYLRKEDYDNNVTGASIDHAIRRCSFKDTQPFTPHDLRRTAASHMTSMGISRLTVSKLLNHVESSVTAIYDRHSYDAEKKHALEAWSNKLKEMIEGVESANNVIKLVSQA